MLKRVTAANRRTASAPSSSAVASSSTTFSSSSSSSSCTAEEVGIPNEAAAYLKSLEDPEVIERVRCCIHDAHVFKLPTRQSAGGWRGGDWTQEVWQGTLKVVERGTLTVILLVDKTDGNVFAVCPVVEGAVDRCVDSSRYFVLRVENAATGRHAFVGVAFNERNDSFDFNISLEDSRREKELELKYQQQEQLGDAFGGGGEPCTDYSIKEGEKIKISVPKTSHSRRTTTRRGNDNGGAAGGAFLKPCSKDTPRRTAGD